MKMKKQILILLLLSIHASAQNPHYPKIQIPVPCSDDFINSYKGKWLRHDPKLSPISVNDYHDEVIKRLYAMTELVRETYPQPMGSDAEWTGTFTKNSFANQVKFVKNETDRVYEEPVKVNSVYRYEYRLDLFPWTCSGKQEIMNAYPIKGFTDLTIDANYASFAEGNYLDGDEWTIDGLPIKKKLPKLEQWKGYDLCTSQGGAYVPMVTDRSVLITRPGEKPYKPVTRQQFLDRAIRYVTRYYDEAVANTKVFSDKAQVEELKKDMSKQKKDALQRLQDELERTTKQGLLSSPAIVSAWPITDSQGDVFTTEAEGGHLLVTENPNYFRKNLPPYVPQFFVLSWHWDDLGWSLQFRRDVEENFPIEKLQAMIDK